MSPVDSPQRRAVLLAGLVGACTPLVQRPAAPGAAFGGARLEPDILVAADGARLPMRVWPAHDGAGAAVAPWAVVIGLHGMNDHSAAFGLPGAYWAAQGVGVYAFDQRGFGRAPGRGVWGGEALMAQDLSTACALVRMRHPAATLGIVGESMGGAVAICALTSSQPPDVDRVVLASPAVWGWGAQPLSNAMALWLTAHVTPGARLTAPAWLARRIRASDNLPELIRMGRDPDMIFATRADATYGLVDLMQAARERIGRLRRPALYLYGAHDDLIPKSAAFHAAAALRAAGGRTAYYADGYHLILRDLHAQRVWDDVLAYLRDPAAPLPSGATDIPARPPTRRPPTLVRSPASG